MIQIMLGIMLLLGLLTYSLSVGYAIQTQSRQPVVLHHALDRSDAPRTMLGTFGLLGMARASNIGDVYSLQRPVRTHVL